MTYPISDVTRRVVYSGSAGTGPYTFTFEVLTQGDIGVYKNSTLLTLTTDYTVTINVDGTGYITLVSAATAADTIAIFGNKGIQRSTDFVTGGDLFANSLNDELDAQTIFAQQNAEAIVRSIRAPQFDTTNVNMVLPKAADRADGILQFDTDGNPTVVSASQFVSGLSGSILGANYITNNATGDGSTVNFTLSTAPGAKGNLQIYIDGVYQNKASFSLSGTTVTFTEAPPLNASIEFIIGYSIGSYGDAGDVSFTQAGTGAATRTVEAKLNEFVSVKDFGAVGDGVTDDTAAIQAALDAHTNVYFPVGTYITSGITVSQDYSHLVFQKGAKLKSTAGTPGELVTITGDYVSVDDPVLDGNTANTANERNLIQVNGSNANINGVIGFNASRQGVFVDGGDYATVRNCYFENLDKDGVQVIRSDNCTVSNISVKDSRYGVSVEEDTNNTYVENVKTDTCQNGLYLITHSGTGTTIKNCTVNGVFCKDTIRAIYSVGASGIDCENIIIRNVTGEGWTDIDENLIWLTGMNNVLVDGVNISDRDTSNAWTIAVINCNDVTFNNINYDVQNATGEHFLFRGCNNVKVINSSIASNARDIFEIDSVAAGLAKNYLFSNIDFNVTSDEWIRLTSTSVVQDVRVSQCSSSTAPSARFLIDDGIKYEQIWYNNIDYGERYDSLNLGGEEARNSYYKYVLDVPANISATTGTLVIPVSFSDVRSSALIKLSISFGPNSNTVGDHVAACYMFRLFSNSSSVTSIAGLTAVMEYGFTAASHFAYADSGSANNSGTITITNPTGELIATNAATIVMDVYYGRNTMTVGTTSAT